MQEKIALIVGASSPIGLSISEKLLMSGCIGWLTYFSNEEKLNAFSNGRRNPKTEIRKIDVTKDAEVVSVIDEIKSRHGKIDYLVNNPSHSDPGFWKREIIDIDPEEMSSIFNVDVAGAFRVIKHALPLLMEAEAPSIVNFSSSAAHKGDPNCAIYNPAQLGVVGLTKTIARAYAPKLRCNAIAPGPIDSSWVDNWLSKEDEAENVERIMDMPRRMGMPEEIATVTQFLLTTDSSYVNGQIIFVDGGVSIA